MADLPNIKSKIQDTEVFKDAELTTDLHTRFGGNINNLLDTSADKRSRLDDKDSFVFSRNQPAVNFSGYYLAPSVGENIVNTNNITPNTSTVFVFLSGIVKRRDTGSFDLLVKRNGVTLRSLTVDETVTPFVTSDLIEIPLNPPVGGDTSLPYYSASHLNFIDTGASAGVANSYQIVVDTTNGGMEGAFLGIQLIGRN